MSSRGSLALLAVVVALAGCERRNEKRATQHDAARAAATTADAGPRRPPAKDPTFFEDTAWGMSAAEIVGRYEAEMGRGTLSRFPGPDEPIIIHRTIDGLPVEINFLVGDQGLRLIEIGVLREYGVDEDDCDVDHGTLADWIAKTAGEPAERDGASTKWITPSTEILVYCDESLGASYQRPR